MKLNVNLPGSSYPIWIERGALQNLSSRLETSRPSILVCDSGIPKKWVDLAAGQFDHLDVFCFEQGEGSKNLQTFEQLLIAMCNAGLNRKSQVIALGGGVAGDMAGFAAACYMRGIDFYNIPTTVLSQVDSSVGGKTAVDLGPVKNIVGAFWQPKAVIIDPDVLSTLDARQISAGLAEALKMGLLFDPELIAMFEQDTLDIDAIIARSIDLKRIVVEQDEKEAGLRKALNFGHTIGHTIEGSYPDHDYLHGECVATGMLYFIENPQLKERVLRIYEKLHLPEIHDFDRQEASRLIRSDKKGNDTGIACVIVDEPGHFRFETRDVGHLDQMMEEDPYEKHIR